MENNQKNPDPRSLYDRLFENTPKLVFTRVREVLRPMRSNAGDAGIDFFIPKLTFEDLLAVEVNKHEKLKGNIHFEGFGSGYTTGNVEIKPGGRVLIPSGIKLLIHPRESAMVANNKSGIATKLGLLITCEVVDSPYVGEVHMGIFNSSPDTVRISLTQDIKLIQFLHVPIIPSIPYEITGEMYDDLAVNWGTRGDKGFGAHDKLKTEE